MAKMYASTLINVATKELGYLEKKSPQYLNSKTKNAGYNNYTKYGRDYGWNGVYWCCQFAWWCHQKAFGSNYTKNGTIKTAGCDAMMAQFKNLGRFNKTPKVGDFIFFETNRPGHSDHIGIVVNVNSSTVYTIEGNTNAGNTVEPNGGGVVKKSYSRSYSRILGYGHPKFAQEPLKAPKPPIEYGSKGAVVRQLQKCLNQVTHLGLVVDGEYGKKTAEAVKSFKVTAKLQNTDGKHYGNPMYKALKKALKS